MFSNSLGIFFFTLPNKKLQKKVLHRTIYSTHLTSNSHIRGSKLNINVCQPFETMVSFTSEDYLKLQQFLSISPSDINTFTQKILN